MRENESMLDRGNLIPHFQVRVTDGRAIDYRDGIWQRKHLVLIALGPEGDDAADASAAALRQHASAIAALDGQLVITHDSVPGVPAPGVVIADRWGEIVFIAAPARASDFPAADDVLEWLQHAQHRCPECEGEAR